MTIDAKGMPDPSPAGPAGFLAAYGRLIRFSHTVFAMPFAMMATFLAADGWPGWTRLGLIIACMVTARSAAMTFNRIVDVRIDAANPRTAGRPLQTGQISLATAWVLYGLCCAAFVACCWGFRLLFGNPWPVVCAAGVLAFVSGYSYTKRFTSLCHLVLGAALGLSPVAAWAAVAPESVGLPALVIGTVVLCWVGGFDIIYALQDLDADRRAGLRSIPARFGPAGALRISRLLHAASVAMMVLLWGLMTPLGWLYLAGVAAAAAVLFIEQALLSPTDYRRAGPVFFYANAIVSIILAAAAIADLLLVTT